MGAGTLLEARPLFLKQTNNMKALATFTILGLDMAISHILAAQSIPHPHGGNQSGGNFGIVMKNLIIGFLIIIVILWAAIGIGKLFNRQ